VSNTWSTEWVSDGEAAARAGGRRKYNAVRRDRAQLRRIEVAQRVMSDGWTYGVQARIAEELGVSDATISRDLKVIFPGAIECPVCACRHPMERWKELERQGRVTMACDSPDQDGARRGGDGYDGGSADERGRDRSSDGRRDEFVAPVDPTYDPPTPDEFRRFMKLTNEMAEQNAVIDVGLVDADASD
jgi:hypothetical protein